MKLTAMKQTVFSFRNFLPASRAVMLRAGWAPAAVFIFHAAIQSTPLRDPLDFTVHFLGGASAAFFAFHALGCFAALVGELRPWARHLFSYSLACTVGLFWEFAELASDTFRHTHIQKNIRETMSDLIADASGAAAALLAVFLVSLLLRRADR